jgi:hypothetical protein
MTMDAPLIDSRDKLLRILTGFMADLFDARDRARA